MVTFQKCVKKFPLVLMGAWSEGQSCADPGRSAPIHIYISACMYVCMYVSNTYWPIGLKHVLMSYSGQCGIRFLCTCVQRLLDSLCILQNWSKCGACTSSLTKCCKWLNLTRIKKCQKKCCTRIDKVLFVWVMGWYLPLIDSPECFSAYEGPPKNQWNLYLTNSLTEQSLGLTEGSKVCAPQYLT